MDDNDYFKFCQEAYRDELKSRDTFTPRLAFLLTAIVAVATIFAKAAALDRLGKVWSRVDVFFFYISSIAAFACLLYAAFRLIRAALPREYEELPSPVKFDAWRSSVRSTLNDPANGIDKELAASYLAEATRDGLIQRLNEATDRNISVNHERTKQVNHTIYGVVGATGFSGIQYLMTLIDSIIKMFG